MDPFKFKASEKFGKASEKIKNLFSDIPSSKIADDVSKLAANAASVALGVKRDAEVKFREVIESYIAKGNLVSRDEFEAVKEMAAKARAEADALKKRLDKLEGVKSESSNAKEKISSKEAPAKKGKK